MRFYINSKAFFYHNPLNILEVIFTFEKLQIFLVCTGLFVSQKNSCHRVFSAVNGRRRDYSVKELGSSQDKAACFGEAQKYFVKENCSDCSGAFAKNV